jgi:hypothetical protein
LGYSAEGRPIYGRFLFEWPKVPWIYESIFGEGSAFKYNERNLECLSAFIYKERNLECLSAFIYKERNLECLM